MEETMKTSARLHAFLPHLILILGALTPPIGRAQWERTALDSGLVSCFIVDNSSLFAGTSTFGGVYRTRDFGKTWAQVNNGLAVLANPVPVIDMAISQSGQGKV